MIRRRRAIEVWPAFADLMTILCVPGLFLAMGLLSALGKDGVASVRQLQVENDRLTQALQEQARNSAMFNAIQEVQRVIDSLASQSNLRFSSDQTLRFGDDLVTFDLNSTSAEWKAGGQSKLRVFCEALQNRLTGRRTELGELSKLFSIEVEGHTDSTACVAKADCNWIFSTGRAVAFRSLMHDTAICPGGIGLDLKPIGYADTKPETISGSDLPRATRRIALRIVPNYQAIISAVELTATDATKNTGMERSRVETK